MQLEITIIDAFTDTLFKGNSAAVIITEQWLADDLMQSVAAENNLSETAFLLKCSDNEYQIRWFSPITEIDFCGHATLASAFVLFSQNPTLNGVHFSAEAVGKMHIARADDGYIAMNFPNRAPHPVTHVPNNLIAGLSIKPADILRNHQAYFAIYEKEEDIYNLKPNSEKLKTLAPFDVVATARSNQYDFISRYFWPANGGVEDPVTGSIHTGLAPYWAEKLDKSRLTAFQASKRGGLLNCQVQGDRVIISGKAVQYLQGSIKL